MPVRHDFDVTFEIKIHERDVGDNVPMEQDALIYYNDGSRQNGLAEMRAPPTNTF
jgi:hypothetical protein